MGKNAAHRWHLRRPERVGGRLLQLLWADGCDVEVEAVLRVLRSEKWHRLEVFFVFHVVHIFVRVAHRAEILLLELLRGAAHTPRSQVRSRNMESWSSRDGWRLRVLRNLHLQKTLGAGTTQTGCIWVQHCRGSRRLSFLFKLAAQVFDGLLADALHVFFAAEAQVRPSANAQRSAHTNERAAADAEIFRRLLGRRGEERREIVERERLDSVTRVHADDVRGVGIGQRIVLELVVVLDLTHGRRRRHDRLHGRGRCVQVRELGQLGVDRRQTG